MPTITRDPKTGAVFFHRTPKEKHLKSVQQKLMAMEPSKVPMRVSAPQGDMEKVLKLEKLVNALLESQPKAIREKVKEILKGE